MITHTTGTLDLSALPPAANEDRELGANPLPPAANDPQHEAATPKPELTEEEKKRLETTGMAAMLIELGAKVAERRWPVIKFSDEEKSDAVELAVPVLMKYDIRSAWLDKFKEEIALGTFLFQLYQEKSAKVEAARLAAKPERESATTTTATVTTDNQGGGAVADPYASLRR